MARGPDKHFNPDEALEQAMLLFWEKGFAAASMTELQTRMGLGAKSLYDTFGNKRELYFSAIGHYTDTVVHKLFGELAAQKSPLRAANSVMRTIAKLDAGAHKGCLLGVAMAQAQLSADHELAAYLEAQIQVIEDALYDTFARAKELGELGEHVEARDMARLYTAAFQGVNLISRVRKDASLAKGVGRALQAASAASMTASKGKQEVTQ